jgi:hypothetical protein
MCTVHAPALTGIATDVRAREAQMVGQEPDQQRAVFDPRAAGWSIHCDCYAGHAFFLAPQGWVVGVTRA